MEDFTMKFKASRNQSNPAAVPVAGTTLNVPLFQEWDDQWMYQVGGAWRAMPALALRLRYNYGDSPVLDRFLYTCLF